MRKHSLDTRVVAHALRPRPRYVYQPDKLENWTPPAARFAFGGGRRHHELMHTSRANTYWTTPARARAPFTSLKSWKTGRPLLHISPFLAAAALPSGPWAAPPAGAASKCTFPPPPAAPLAGRRDRCTKPEEKKKQCTMQSRVSVYGLYANRR